MRVEVVVRKGLGKNMDSVFSMKNVADVIDNPKVPEPKSSLPLSSLKPGKFQPRNDVENSGLSELAQSIKQNGILNPIVVRKYPPTVLSSKRPIPRETSRMKLCAQSHPILRLMPIRRRFSSYTVRRTSLFLSASPSVSWLN